MASQLLTTNDAAKILDRSPATVRFYEREGKLSATRTAGGVRLFERIAVERLAHEMAERSRRNGQ